jgi:chromosome segregation ATPase
MRKAFYIFALILLLAVPARAQDHEQTEGELAGLSEKVQQLKNKRDEHKAQSDLLAQTIEKLKRAGAGGVVDAVRLRTLMPEALERAQALAVVELELAGVEKELDHRRANFIAQLERELDRTERLIKIDPSEELLSKRERIVDLYLRQLIRRYERYNFKPIEIVPSEYATPEELREAAEFIGLQREKLGRLIEFLTLRLNRLRKERALEEFIREQGFFQDTIGEREVAVGGGSRSGESGIPVDGSLLADLFSQGVDEGLDRRIEKSSAQLKMLREMDAGFKTRQEEIRAEAGRREVP